MTTNSIRHLQLVFLGLVSLVSCDRLQEQIKSKTTRAEVEEARTPAEIEEAREFSMDSLMDRAIKRSVELVEESQKAGKKNTVGLADGKWWSDADNATRVVYLRGVSDSAEALAGISGALIDEAKEQVKATNAAKIFYRIGDFTDASYMTANYLVSRLSLVMSGHTFGDIMQAVSNFYRNKPLQKDKPIIWVLAFPLYNEFQESLPKEKRSSFYDTISVPMKRGIQK